MKISLRLISLISAALLFAGVLFACGKSAGENETPGITTSADGETAETVETERLYSSEIEAVDYGGYEFHMATNGLNIEYHSPSILKR